MIPLRNILVHGSATIDLICSGFYEIDGSRVLIQLSPKSKESIELEVSDGPITIGAKHTLTRSLERIVEVPHIYSTSGGGGINSVNAFSTLDQDLGLTFLGLSEPHEYFERDFRLRGISSQFLGKHKPPINLVLGIGNDRTILRSPIAASPFNPNADNWAIDEAIASSHAVLINSVKDSKLAAYLLEKCEYNTRGARLSTTPAYVVVTPDFNLNQAGAHPHVISSYEDFLKMHGINASTQSHKQNFQDTVKILKGLQISLDQRNFYITLGEHGAIYCNHSSMGHVMLEKDVWEDVQTHLRKNPEKKLGAGDVFAAAAVYYETLFGHAMDMREVTKRACMVCIEYFRFRGTISQDSFVVQQIR